LPFLTELSAFNVHIEHCADTSAELRNEKNRIKQINTLLNDFIIQIYAKSNANKKDSKAVILSLQSAD
jgi:hypothetical protein